MTTSPSGGGGGGATTRRRAVPTTLFADFAVMVTLPAARPVATPLPSTVAMVTSLLVQVKVVVTGALDASNAAAVYGVVAPTFTSVESGVTVTVATTGVTVPHGCA